MIVDNMHNFYYEIKINMEYKYFSTISTRNHHKIVKKIYYNV